MAKSQIKTFGFLIPKSRARFLKKYLRYTLKRTQLIITEGLNNAYTLDLLLENTAVLLFIFGYF